MNIIYTSNVAIKKHKIYRKIQQFFLYPHGNCEVEFGEILENNS